MVPPRPAYTHPGPGCTLDSGTLGTRVYLGAAYTRSTRDTYPGPGNTWPTQDPSIPGQRAHPDCWHTRDSYSGLGCAMKDDHCWASHFESPVKKLHGVVYEAEHGCKLIWASARVGSRGFGAMFAKEAGETKDGQIRGRSGAIFKDAHCHCPVQRRSSPRPAASCRRRLRLERPRWRSHCGRCSAASECGSANIYRDGFGRAR